MNIPEIYLVEPYNAYTAQKGGRKKHWMEVVEEQALLQKIIADQIAIQEAASRTVPPTAPEISSPSVGGTPAGGAGGSPPPQAFYPTASTVNFDRTPSVGAAPLTVRFLNYTSNPQLYSYRWNFGDGTTSTDISPTHLYQTQSGALNLWTASLTASSLMLGVVAGFSPLVYTSASIPVVTSLFTLVTSSNIGPVTGTFTNTSTNTSQTPTTTYRWLFGDSTSSVSTSPTHAYANTGSFTASLQATGSYGIASSSTRSFFVTAPTLTAAFTFTTSSNTSMSVATFTNTTTYNGHGSLTYLFSYGTASITTTNAVILPLTYSKSGPYTASLQVTESSYNIASFITRSWRLS